MRKELLSPASAVVAAVVVGAACLAWYHIHTASIWYDEAITLLTLAGHAHPDWSLGSAEFAGSAGFIQILSELYRFDVHPPLYFWVVALWRFFAGHSLESIRVFSALFTLASIGLLYRTAAAFPMRYPAVPALIYAFSSAAIAYAYTARPYAMADFLIVLTLYCAQRKNPWAGVVAAGCIAAHYFAALCVAPVLMVYCLTRLKTDRRWVLTTAGSFIALSFCLLPLLLVHFGARPAQYSAPASFAADVKASLTGVFATAFPDTSVWWLKKAAMLAIAIGALAGAFRSCRSGAGVAVIAWAAFIIGFFVLQFVTHKSIADMPVAYYFGFTAPLMALMLGFGVDAVPLLLPVSCAGLVSRAWLRERFPSFPGRTSAPLLPPSARNATAASSWSGPAPAAAYRVQ